MREYSKEDYVIRLKTKTYYLISKKQEPNRGLFKINREQFIDGK